MRTLLYLLFFLFLTSGCKTYYTISDYESGDITTTRIDSLNDANRVFILRTPDGAYQLNDFWVNRDRNTLHFVSAPLAPSHRRHVNYSSLAQMTYVEGKDETVREVHLYTRQQLGFSNNVRM